MDKESIYRACLEQLADIGMGSVSLSNVANALGVRKSSLYFYIKDKDELVRNSIKYAENCINISNFTLDLSLEVSELFSKVFQHYYKVFSSPISRCYLSCIMRISEYEMPDFMTPEDIIYTFETQVSVILLSLIDNKKVKISSDFIDNYSHIIALLIFEMITQSDSEEKAMWYISKSIDAISQLLFFCY